jgi:hypothetical protein
MAEKRSAIRFLFRRHYGREESDRLFSMDRRSGFDPYASPADTGWP